MKKKPLVADGSIHLVSDLDGSDFLVILVPMEDDADSEDGFISEKENEVSH